MSLLHEAASKDDMDLLEVAIKKGMDPNEADLDWGGRTPLHVACAMGYTDCVELLLSYEVKVNVQRTTDGWTPLHCACEAGNIACVKLLLAAGAKIDIEDFCGDLPNRIAEMYGHANIAQILNNSVVSDSTEHCLCTCASEKHSKHSPARAGQSKLE